MTETVLCLILDLKSEGNRESDEMREEETEEDRTRGCTSKRCSVVSVSRKLVHPPQVMNKNMRQEKEDLEETGKKERSCRIK